MAYAYAAYKKGADLGLPEGLDVDEFRQLFAEKLQGLGYAELWTPLEGQKPLGLIGMDIWGHRVFPHAIWWPWASSRQRLEVSVHVMNEIRKSRPAFVIVREDDRKLFDRLCDYRILRIVGKPNNWFSDGEPAIWYQSLDLV